MSGSYDHRQAKIDALLSNAKFDKISVQKKLLELAKKGMDHPANLTEQEIRAVCCALIIQYITMSIE